MKICMSLLKAQRASLQDCFHTGTMFYKSYSLWKSLIFALDYKKTTNISNIWCGLILIFRIMKIWEFARYLHNFVTFFIISRPLYLLSFHKTSLYVCNFPGYTYFCECTYSNLEVILKTFYFSPRLSLHYLVIWTTTQFCFLYFVRQ